MPAQKIKKEEILKTIDSLLDGVCGNDEICYKDMIRRIDSNSILPEVWKKIARDVVALKKQHAASDGSSPAK
ncbi:MAG: hypothetical protein M1331_00735 [Candidatus Marsarchaeota archaeon]|nr:hypothetical protein [Candidatus Marsarchaeota archaeon]MCL5105910.1 hypothetical protein [Candidatus Marsarchaeota archaeon]